MRHSVSWLLKFVQKADGSPHPACGFYLRSYAPSPPRGSLEVTDDPRLAQRFPTINAVCEAWKTEIGTRPDGRPNRPLTAFTIRAEEFVFTESQPPRNPGQN